MQYLDTNLKYGYQCRYYRYLDGYAQCELRNWVKKKQSKWRFLTKLNFKPYLHALTFVFVAAVCLVTLVVAVWVAVAHRHRQ